MRRGIIGRVKTVSVATNLTACLRLPFAFPEDPDSFSPQGVYMFGPDLLVAPVLEPDATTREVYLPRGTDWVHVWTGDRHPGGAVVTVAAPPGQPPVFSLADRWRDHQNTFDGH